MDFIKHLRDHKKSFTRVRAEVWSILTQSEKPLSPREIHLRLLKRYKADLATVYRNLDALKAAGLVKEVDLRETFKRWEPIWPGQHVHHIKCQTCGDIERLNYCALENMAETVKNRLGYVLMDHYLECFGICPKCQSKEHDVD